MLRSGLYLIGIVGLAASVAASATAQAQTSIDLVTIGHPGNASELSGDRMVGGVDYSFLMGKFEVTNGQFIEFLNSVATTDTYGLSEGLAFNGGLPPDAGIERTGTDGNYWCCFF